MKLVTYNIQFGLGKDGRYDLARIAEEVKPGYDHQPLWVDMDL